MTIESFDLHATACLKAKMILQARRVTDDWVNETMDNEVKIQIAVDGLLQQLCGVQRRREKSLRPLLTALVAGDRPMTALDLAELPVLRRISMTTLYRMLVKLDEAGLLRRLTHQSRADLLVINLPERHRNYLICDQCGKTVELPILEAQWKMETEYALQTGWSRVKLDVNLCGLCPTCDESLMTASSSR